MAPLFLLVFSKRCCTTSTLLTLLFRPDLMVKKLRYYARFIVVSLLLNKVDLVKELIQVIISLAVVYT